MSVTYKLELGPPATPDAVAAALTEVRIVADDGVDEDGGRARIAEARAATRGALRGGGWFDVDPAEDDPPDPVERRFGFAPAVDVYLGLAVLSDVPTQVTDVLRLALGVLDRVAGDALLHRAHEDVWLLRRHGRLTVDAALWTPEQLGLLRSRPYEDRSLAFD